MKWRESETTIYSRGAFDISGRKYTKHNFNSIDLYFTGNWLVEFLCNNIFRAYTRTAALMIRDESCSGVPHVNRVSCDVCYWQSSQNESSKAIYTPHCFCFILPCLDNWNHCSANHIYIYIYQYTYIFYQPLYLFVAQPPGQNCGWLRARANAFNVVQLVGRHKPLLSQDVHGRWFHCNIQSKVATI